MTRAEFYDEIDSWWRLKDFCIDVGCGYCDDVYDDESRDEYLNDDIEDWARNNTWMDLRDMLSNLETGYEYWRLDDYGDWIGLDEGSDFREARDEVAEWCDDNGMWDEEEDEDEDDEEDAPEEESDPEDEVPTEAEDFSFSELFVASVCSVQSIQRQEIEQAQELERAFSTLVSVNNGE